jgi:hypothetical protein
MLRKTRNVAVVHTQGVQGRESVVTAFGTIGIIVNCQAAYSHLMLKKHMIGLLSISSKYGVRS